jgi:hypothetical protein
MVSVLRKANRLGVLHSLAHIKLHLACMITYVFIGDVRHRFTRKDKF